MTAHTVLVSNDQQCSVAAIVRQQEDCFTSSFPDVLWYYASVDEICQYA